MKPALRSIYSIFIAGILLLGGCSVSTQPTTLKWGEFDLYRVTATTATGDSSYILAVAQFYQDGDASKPVMAGTVTLNGKSVPYDYAHNYYTTDSIATQLGYDEWAVTGSGSIPAFSIRLNTPPSLAITSPTPKDTVRSDTAFTIQWTPSVSGGNIGVEVDNDSLHTAIYSSLPISDVGSTSISPLDFSSGRKGKIDIFVFRDNTNTQESGDKAFIANSESEGRVTITLH